MVLIMQQMKCICTSLLMLALSAGCGQSDIKVYRVAKEARQPELTAGLKWNLPAGWEEVPPGEMRLASFRIKGENGKQADVSIVPLGGRGGGDLDNVNRWRVQQ